MNIFITVIGILIIIFLYALVFSMCRVAGRADDQADELESKLRAESGIDQ